MTLGIRSGDESAFNLFYDAYVDRLYRHLLVLMPYDEETVREALQETMLRVLRYVKPVRDERILWSWLRRVARSALVDVARRTARRRRREEPLPFEPEQPEDAAEPDADAVLIAALRRAVGRLSADEQELLDAYYTQGRSQDDIARTRSTTRKAVESRLARLRARLKPMIREELRDADAR